MGQPDNEFASRNYENVINTILSQSYEIHEDWEEERPEQIEFYGDEEGALPLFEEEDRLILMHREAHFSGSFSAMRHYYQRPDAKGVIEEIDRERIDQLAHIEAGLKKDLAHLLLSGADVEKIALSKKLYQELGEIAQKSSDSPEGCLAMAILSEKDVDELVATMPPQVLSRPHSLISLATSDLLCDPLFPGYGTASRMAIELLGRLRCESAVSALFGLIGRRDFHTETSLLSALRKIGEPAKAMAIERLKTHPYTIDHERAVLVLLEFLPDDDISKLFSTILADTTMSNERLRGYLRIGVVE